MNSDESINTDDVPTLGNISQTPAGARGESINLSISGRVEITDHGGEERSHQTTKQANITRNH